MLVLYYRAKPTVESPLIRNSCLPTKREMTHTLCTGALHRRPRTVPLLLLFHHLASCTRNICDQYPSSQLPPTLVHLHHVHLQRRVVPHLLQVGPLLLHQHASRLWLSILQHHFFVCTFFLFHLLNKTQELTTATTASTSSRRVFFQAALKRVNSHDFSTAGSKEVQE